MTGDTTTSIRAAAQRMGQITAIYFQLDRLFADDEAIFDWLSRRAQAFNSASVSDLLRTEEGIEQITVTLKRHGARAFV